MDFKINNMGRASGRLLGYVSLTLTEVVAAFGNENLLRGAEPEKGYDNEIFFEGPEGGDVCLYDRWGEWRLGGTDPELAAQFAQWLSAKLGRDVNYQPLR